MKFKYNLEFGKTARKFAKVYDGKRYEMPIIVWPALKMAESIASFSSDMLKCMANQLSETNGIVKLSHQPTLGKLEDGAITLNWKVKKSADNKCSISHTGGSLGFNNIYLENRMQCMREKANPKMRKMSFSICIRGFWHPIHLENK